MAISFVNDAEYEFAGTADTAVTAAIPTTIQAGDLLICAHGNVSSQLAAATMNNSWTKIREEGIDGTNCYFLVAAKIATATEVSAAGSTVQVATQSDSAGNTNKTSKTLAYRGTKSTVGTAIIASNSVHETSPADETINTGSATATASTQWYVFFYNMAGAGNQSADTFSTDAGTIRTPQAVHNNSTSTTSGVCGGDSNATISAASHSRNGTWSNNSTRLNAAILILDPSSTSASAGTLTATGTSNAPKASVGAKAQVIG